MAVLHGNDRNEPNDTDVTAGGAGGPAADAAIGFCNGVLGGITGLAGILVTIWCGLRGWPKDVQRAVIQNFNLAMLAVTFTSYLFTGIATREMVPLFAIVAPAMLVPSLLGARLYLGIGETAFRKVVLGLLTASGVAMLVAAVPVLIQRI